MVTEVSYSSEVAKAIKQATFPETPQNLYDPIRYILGLSGKRIRPTLVLLSAEMFGLQNLQQAIPAALAVEYFHNFSLMHDDIMDKAPLRRGAATVHTKWNDNVAILSGDALLVKAYEQISACPSEKIPALLKVFNELAIEVCEGQQLDMDYETMDHVREQEYIAMIRAKTSVLLGGALRMGAILANADEKQQNLVYEFGVNLGIAFQLQDDILDVFGNPEDVGKQVGGDILADKKTILRIKLFELAASEDLKALEEEKLSNEDKILKTIDLYNQFEVKQYAEQLKEYYSGLAFKNLEEIPLDLSKKQYLHGLAKQLMNRKF